MKWLNSKEIKWCHRCSLNLEYNEEKKRFECPHCGWKERLEKGENQPFFETEKY